MSLTSSLVVFVCLLVRLLLPDEGEQGQGFIPFRSSVPSPGPGTWEELIDTHQRRSRVHGGLTVCINGKQSRKSLRVKFQALGAKRGVGFLTSRV